MKLWPTRKQNFDTSTLLLVDGAFIKINLDLQQLQRSEGQLVTSSPIDPNSASARIITLAASQTEMNINLGHDLEQDSNLTANPKSIDSNRVLKNEDLKNTDWTNILKQEHYTSEFSVVTGSLINERVHKQPQLQVLVQEFQKLQLGQPQDPISRLMDDIANLNISDMSRRLGRFFFFLLPVITLIKPKRALGQRMLGQTTFVVKGISEHSHDEFVFAEK